jgi:hypothetical protein
MGPESADGAGRSFLARHLRNYRIFVSVSWACRTESDFCIFAREETILKI